MIFKPKLTPEIPPDFPILAQAVTTNNRAANRLWLFAASASAIIASVHIGEKDTAKFLGIEMNKDTLYFFAAYVLAFVNFAFCSARAQAIRAANIYEARIRDARGEYVSYATGFKLIDIAFTLPAPDFVRVYPLVSHSPGFLKKFYAPTKYFLDIILVLVPLIGLFILISDLDIRENLTIDQIPELIKNKYYGYISILLSIMFYILLIASAFSSIIILYLQYKMVNQRS